MDDFDWIFELGFWLFTPIWILLILGLLEVTDVIDLVSWL